ncbi:MAG TPA: redoxin domain-containing protein [Kofleriaceae bacterium]|nr:redoxin domain-containing protein [Kofleriaceae bacterium]
MRFVWTAALAASIACAGTAGADPPQQPAKPALSKKPPRTPKSRPAPTDDDGPAWLGIGLERSPRGVKVTEVMEGTPAARVGLRVGDEITAVDGVALASERDLIERITGHRGGDKVKLEVARGARKLAVTAVLETKPDEQEMLERRLLDRPAPDFDLPVVGADAGGTTISLASLRGKVVVIEFLATWCYPCKTTYKQMSDLQDARGADGLVVLGVSAEEAAKLDGLVKQEGMRFRLGRDVGGAMTMAYGARGTPTFAVIDREGVVRFVGSGAGLAADHTVFAAERLLDTK